MEIIVTYIEKLIEFCGLTGSAVPVVRHILLVVVAVLLAWLSDLICRRLLIPVIHKITARTQNTWDEAVLNDRVLKAACHIVPAIVVWELLPMVFYQFPMVRELLARLTAIYITVTATHLLLVLLGGFSQLKRPTSRQGKTGFYLQSLCGVLKIVILFIAVIVVVGIAINKSPLALLAGLGAASAVLMLVFKDTIEGLVAGVRLTSNDMLRRGDWITVPAANADGVVEAITLTTVKVRNYDNTIVTVSPITLVNGSFQNWRGMQTSSGRRVKRLLYIDFRSLHTVQTEQGEVTNLTQYRQAIEDYLAHNELVNTRLIYMVRLMEATQCGLPIEVYFFLKEKSWKEYEHQQSSIMEYIYALAPQYGLKIYEQYPEQ